MMRRGIDALLLAWNLLAAWCLWRSLEESQRWPEPPARPVRGTAFSEPVTARDASSLEVETQPGELDLSRFVIPGYDPPELRQDPSPLPASAFPAAVRALDGTRVRVRGHVLALRSSGEVHEFLLNRYPPGCCFGALPALDEWILVSAPEGFVPPAVADPVVAVEGRLEIGERQDAEGFATSLYRMTAERVEP